MECHEKSVTKNATKVDGGAAGWGNWCGVAVPTMMGTVAAVRRRRNIFQYPHSNYLQMMECEGEGCVM